LIKVLSKIALGTVQFGLRYGINNQKGILQSEEIKEIFELAYDHGIRLLDTAPVYGDAEEKIAQLSGNRFNVITKLPAREAGVAYSREWLTQAIDTSMVRLKTTRLEGVLLHKPADILDKDGDSFYEGLQQMKQEGRIGKVGISIYTPPELDTLLKNYDFDIVQAPFNILDRRMVDSGWLKKLAAKGTEVHVRSVFLQGLLLMLSAERPEKFERWAPLWKKYDTWLAENGITQLEACIRYALSFPEISNVIVGIDSLDHLKKIINAAEGELPEVPSDLATNDTDLLNPLSWLEF
jgi:aryl-alcohol dehydrogenase-like predicted oxidoreductase